MFSKRRLLDRLSFSWIGITLFLVVFLPFLMATGLSIKSWPLIAGMHWNELLLSSVWKPSSGQFGFLSFLISSLWVTAIALCLAAPVCLFTALYLTQYAKGWLLRWMHPVIDILAGIPSVIYGVWGILLIVPFVGEVIGPIMGRQGSGYSLLSGGIVLAVMISPFILNILIEVFQTILPALNEASLSLGATQWETTKYVIVRRAFPGIISAFSLGVSRAFGETIAVLMVVGNVVGIPGSPLDPGYPLPALIANNYGEMLSIPLYDSALMFSALLLLGVVLLFNFLARLAISGNSNH